MTGGAHGTDPGAGPCWQPGERRVVGEGQLKSLAEAKCCSSDRVCPGEGSTLGKWLNHNYSHDL